MVRTKVSSSTPAAADPSLMADAPDGEAAETMTSEHSSLEMMDDDEADFDLDESDDIDPDQIDSLFKDLKSLLSTVEKLQKVREEVGDIKPLIIRLLDGELLEGDELEQLKSGVGGLSKLVRLYGDYQMALEQAQPARILLDQVIKG